MRLRASLESNEWHEFARWADGLEAVWWSRGLAVEGERDGAGRGERLSSKTLKVRAVIHEKYWSD